MGATVSFKEAAARLGYCWRHVYRIAKVVDGQVPADWVDRQLRAREKRTLARQRREEAKIRARKLARERIKKARARLLDARGSIVVYDEARMNLIASRAVLNPKEVLEIRSRYVEGETQKELSEWYDVSLATIQNILSRRSWRHV